VLQAEACASSWLITEINIMRCTVSKMSKNAGQYVHISCQCSGNSLPNSMERNSFPGTNIHSCGQANSLFIQKKRPLASAQVSSTCFYPDPHMYSLH